MTGSFLGLSKLFEEQTAEKNKDNLLLFAMLSVLSKEMPTFGAQLGQTLEDMESDIKATRSI